MTTLFISDIHLSIKRPHKLALFLKLLAAAQDKVEALYILGDLFDVWLGDDDKSPLAQSAVDGLARFCSRGVPLYLMRGNRDFLLDAGFEHRTGGRILDEPAIIDLYGVPTALVHGDSLCTLDVEYQAFRKKLYAPEWKQAFLARPFAERLALANQIRQASDEASSKKPPEIMDVTQDAVIGLMNDCRVHHLIHGHTHLPQVHRFELRGRPATRTVLGDWYQADSVLVATPGQQTLMRVDDYLAGLQPPDASAEALRA